MKKAICIVLSVIIVFFCFSFGISAQTQENQKPIDTTLLAELKLYLAGVIKIIEQCDFNLDDKITTADLAILKLKLAGNDEIIPTLKFTQTGHIIEEKNGITYIEGTIIVNKTYSLPDDYEPGLLKECENAFEIMKQAAKKDGINIWISSGYRSYSVQKNLYENYLKNDFSQNVDTYSARPGHSEHQTGLAIDVNKASSTAFETTYKKVGEWLSENCYNYGFIIRYPKGKEDITGYIHEPWHIRYVGVDLALKIKDSGLCLEEYFGITSEYKKED